MNHYADFGSIPLAALRFLRRLLFVAALLDAHAALLPSACGALKVWSGGAPGNGNWSTGANWAGIAPAPGDDLLFPNTVQGLKTTNDFVNRGFNSITFSGANYVVQGNPLFLTNGLSAQHSNFANTFNPAITLHGPQTIECAQPSATLILGGDLGMGTNNLTFNAVGRLATEGVISGSATVTKNGSGTLAYEGKSSNTYTNLTTINGGTFELHKLGFPVSATAIAGPIVLGNGVIGARMRNLAFLEIADTANVTINRFSTWDLNNLDETIANLTLIGGAVITGTGTLNLGGNLTALSSTTNATIAGNISLGAVTHTVDVADGPLDLLITAAISGTGGLTKRGLGTLTLTGQNGYAGETDIEAGTLLVTGAQPQSPVRIEAAGTLRGSGTVGNITSLSGSLQPGSPGILISSNLSLNASTVFAVNLNSPNPGTGYDRLNTRGANNKLGGAALVVNLAFAPVEGQQFVILKNDGGQPITGTFDGKPNGSIFTANNVPFQIQYFQGLNNDVVLTVTNTSARFVSALVTGGNGDGNLNINECNLLNVTIANRVGVALSSVTATLVPKTPGVSVTFGTAAYPDIPVAGHATNTTPFQFSTSPNFVCGTNIDFEIVVGTAGHGAVAIPFSITSALPCGDGGGGCQSCPEKQVIRGTLGRSSLMQAGRLVQDQNPSNCNSNKLCPGPLSGDVTARHYDAYLFENGESNACINVSLQSESDLFSAAYLNSYNPSNFCQNYLADSGAGAAGTGLGSYAFKVTPRQRFVIVVNESDANGGCGYTLSVDGGSCRPQLVINPVAGNKIALDWSTAALGYNLEQTNAISRPPHPAWPRMPGAPIITGGRFRMTNNVSPARSFYQLRKP